MLILRKNLALLFLVILFAVLASCSAYEDSHYKDGFYRTTLKYSFEDVYKAAVETIESGQTFDEKGNPYDLRINKKTDTDAVLEAYNDSNSADYIIIKIKKVSQDETMLSIKYGQQENSMIASSVASIIEGNVKYV